MGRRVLVVLGAWTLVATPLAQADFYDEIYRGLQVLATPSGGPLISTGDGGQVNGARSGRLRILPDAVGRGYSLEFDRSFGVDTRGRPEVLDLGAFEMQLSGQTQATIGYTNRGFLIGNANTVVQNLQYAIRGKTGAQDAELTGVLNGTTSMEINQFGFYTMDVNLNNTNSQLVLDGVLVRDEQDADFDIGPIAIEGNIFFDGLVALLASFGVDTNPLEALSPKSPIDRITDLLTEELKNQAAASGVRLGTSAASLSSDPATQVAGLQLIGPERNPNEVRPSERRAADAQSDAAAQLVPEPASLALLLIGAAGLLRRR